jgi:hypothetical protein
VPIKAPLRPLDEEPLPSGWDWSDPETVAIVCSGYEDTAEYHYAMAERERVLREGK